MDVDDVVIEDENKTVEDIDNGLPDEENGIHQLNGGMDDEENGIEEGSVIGNEKDLDTDLEDEEPIVAFDHTGRTFYVDACKKVGVIPAGYFLRHMHDPNLDMRHHGLGAVGVQPICSSLVSNGTVLKLDLTDNWLGREGCTPVMDMLRENCFISDLVLSDNRLGNECVELLAEVLSTNPQLTHVNLSGNEFDDKSAVHFAELISTCIRIEYLNLSHNDFGEQTGIILSKPLADNNTLVELDLSWNHIRGKGAKGLCVGLTQNTYLKVLNLGWNGFGPVFGAQEMGKALKTNATLEELDLTNNRINPEGAVLLGKGLAMNTVLRVLKIGRNPMQTAGCYGIVNSIMKNLECSLVSIDFQDILVNNDFKELYQQSLEQFPDLKVFTGTRIPERPKSKVPPMIKLRNYAIKNNIRLIDFFNHFDDDDDLKISKQEFLIGIEESGLPLTPDEINRLVVDLDKDGDGQISYGELAVGVVNADSVDPDSQHTEEVVTQEDTEEVMEEQQEQPMDEKDPIIDEES